MAKELINPAFDYGLVTDHEKGILINCEGRLAQSKGKVNSELVKHGEILHDAQQALSNHGNGVFGQWLEAVGETPTGAYRAIAIYSEFKDSPNLAQFQISALYALASNPKAKKKAMRLAEKGHKITHARAKELIAASQPAITQDNPPEEEEPEEPQHEQAVGRGQRDEPEEPEDDYGECPNCGGDVWDNDDGVTCLKCYHPHGEPVGNEDEPDPKELAKKNKTLAHSYRDKLARAICDYHEVAPNRKERDRLVKMVQGVSLW